jgi:hypothetical protein
VTDLLTVRCWARNRRSDHAVVHLALPNSDQSICGVWRGDSASDIEVSCLTCRMMVEDEAKRRSRTSHHDLTMNDSDFTVLSAELADLSAQIDIAPTHALVYMPYSLLLRSIVQKFPSARWDRESHAWVISSSQVNALIDDLRAAGVSVATTILASQAWMIAFAAVGVELAPKVYDSVMDALPVRSQQRQEFETGYREWLQVQERVSDPGQI